MSSTLDEQINQLKQAIAEMEAKRAVLGDATVEAALVPLHKKLAEIETQVEPSVDEQQELPTRQRKLVTLLYMDVVGSTAMTQHLDPEDTLEIMDNALPRLAAPITAHGGHVTRYTGDGFKAVFGDPVAREDDPEQAIRAGLEILELSQSVAQEIESEWDIEDFQVRIGIDTGLAALGGQTEAEDTVMGRVVNMAVRIESAAPPGGLLISHNTYRHVRGVFTVEPRDPITAKGFPEPVPVYLVKEAKPRAFRMQTRGVEGVETQMVGRRTEIDILKDALLTAFEESEGQVFTISGEAGVGKSRLLYEYQNWLDLLPSSQGVRFFQGRGSQEAQRLPYSLLRDIFSFRFQVLDGDQSEQVRQKVESGFCEIFGGDEDGVMRAHILGQLLGFNFSASPHLKGVINDAEQLRNRGLMYLKDYFQSLSQENPIVIFLEDIHWGDDSSLDVVSRIGEFTPQHPILLVCAARPILFERRPYWGEGQEYQTLLELRPLSRRESRQLVAEILKLTENIPTELRDLIVRGAEGNPFYTEELIKMLIEDDVVIPDEDTWKIDMTRFEEVEVPSTLAGVLQARLDSLPVQERTVLQQASVVGRLFWDRIIEYIQVEEGNDDDSQLIPQTLTALRNRELVYRHEESVFVDAVEYLFKHDILREVTYESVIKQFRRTYHGLIANWLISNCGDRIGENSGMIADHLLMAGRGEQACEYYIQAGEYALLSYANQDAETQFRRALSLECEEIDKSKLLEGLGDTLERQDHWEEAIQTWNEAIDLNLEQKNFACAARLYAKSSRAYGFLPRNLETCLEGLKWIIDEPESHDVAMLLHETGRAYYLNGKHDEALDYCQQAFKMAERLGNIEIQADTLATLGIIPSQSAEAALAALTRAVELAHQGNFLGIESRALNNLGVTRWNITGDILRTKEDYEHALAIAKQCGDLSGEWLFSWNLLNLDFKFCELSKIESAGYSFKSFEAQLPVSEPPNQGFIFFKAFFLGLQGEFQRSFEILNECLDVWREYENLHALSLIHNKIADLNFEIHWSGGATNWQEVEEALNDLTDLGVKGITNKASALCMLSIAKTFQGNLQEAHQYLETAKEVNLDDSPFQKKINISKATAHLAVAESRWDDSFAAFEDLSKKFSQKGYRWELAHTLCDLGDAHVSRGEIADLEAARKLYNQAVEIYSDLEASWYKGQVEKRLERITQ